MAKDGQGEKDSCDRELKALLLLFGFFASEPVCLCREPRLCLALA